ncbi:hypothetical protein [Paraconexibacter sp.]|uniref:hypothetical protein n=1 Tax=Paraconexibacter sp. TaxID=2949640 RepID=UPI0035699C75
MTALAAWTLVPVVFVALVTGWGLLADRALDRPMPASLLPGAGLSLLVVVTGLVVLVPGAGPLTISVAGVGALAGLVLGRGRLRDADVGAWGPPLLAAAGVLVVHALPTLLDGAGVIGGDGRLDDSGTWLGLTDRVIEYGRDVDGLPPGTYTRVLQDYLGQGYPVGSLLPVGVSARLSLQDTANAYQPVLAGYAVVLACSLYASVRTVVASRVAAALAVFLAAQASLFYGYAQWGGVKELATAALLATAAPLAVRAWRRDGARDVALALVVAGALAGTLGVDGVPWILPAAGVALLGWIAVGGARRNLRALPGLAVLAGVVALPALVTADLLLKTSPTTFGANAVSDAEKLGRLLAPLDLLQGAGLWPREDFRVLPDSPTLLRALALVVVVLAVWGLVVALRRRAAAFPVLIATVGLGTVVIIAFGTPWIDAKALAVTSPMVLALAGATVARAAADERRPAALLAAVVLITGVGLSTVLVMRSTPAVPRAPLAELRDIGERFAGEGPTLFLAHQVYATRHFLRDMAVEGASERRDRFVYLRDGSLAPNYTEVNVESVAPADLAVYRLIVRRREAPGRMPAGYRLAHQGEHWEVWRRPG